MHGGTELLYLDDSYLKNCEAVVVKVLDRGVVLDRTCFHPRGGGLVSDTGVLTHDKGEARVVEALFVEEGVLHVLEGSKPSEGSRVCCTLDWGKTVQNYAYAHRSSCLGGHYGGEDRGPDNR
jgi:misacylated tRNA(Ala) deacylase